MKHLIILILLSCITVNLFGQTNCDSKFKELYSLSKKDTITPNELSASLQIVKALELNRCTDYNKTNKKGDLLIDETLTSILGKICLKSNSHVAINAYINYMKRHHGSAEEEISFSFERLFVQQPEYVLTVIGYDKTLLNQLEWGFVNNHSKPGLTAKNYKTVFYQVNPKIKTVYPKYKKQIDYLLNTISNELKG
jgi:hypothetical protein